MKKESFVFQGDTILTTENLALVTDLTSGFSQEQAKEIGFDMIYFSVNLNYDGQEIAFMDGNDDNETFYARLADPKTTGAKTGSSIDGFCEIFKKRLEEGKLVVYLGVTDSMSAGMRNAALTAKQMVCDEYPEAEQNILIPHTRCIAGGLGLALRMIQSWLFSGKPRTLDELMQKVEEIGDHMSHIFTLFSYEFMKNSGRFASTKDQLKIMLAKTMKIYPIMLSPRIGPLQPTWKKVRGDRALIEAFIDIYAETAQDPETGEVEIDYSGTTDNSNTAYKKAEELRRALRVRFPNIKIRTAQTGPSVGCHVGPDEMSFFFLQKEVRPDMLS
jgi:DegV family protein with EDD domain